MIATPQNLIVTPALFQPLIFFPCGFSHCVISCGAVLQNAEFNRTLLFQFLADSLAAFALG